MNKKLLVKVLLVMVTTSILAITFWDKRNKLNFTESQMSLSGKLITYQGNKKGDIDSLIVSLNNKPIKINFPPHKASSVLKIAPKNSNVQISYLNKIHFLDSKSHNDLINIKNLDNNHSLVLDNVEVHPVDKGISKNLVLKNYKINIDDRNTVNAIIYDKYFIDVRPHILKEIIPLMDKAKKIEIKGLLRSEDGFVNSDGYEYFKAESLILDNKIYLLK